MLRLDDRRTLVEQLRLMLAQTGASMVPTILLVALLVLTLSHSGNSWAMQAWGLVQVGFKLFCAWDARRRLARGFGQEEAPGLAWWLLALNVLDGLVWGSLGWITLGNTDLSKSILVVAVLAGVSGASMGSLSPVPQVFYAFITALLVTMVARMWMLGGPDYNALGLASLLYAGTLVGQARNTSRAIRAAIGLRFENDELIQRLRVETGNALAATHAAEEANIAKSRFLAAASHDLRQPIHALGLFLGVLARSRLNDSQREVLESASAASEASAEMLNTLLDFSRIEAGVIAPQLRAFPLQQLLNKIENDLAPQADAKGIVYRSREARAVLRSDKGLLELILRNLVSNAIRYTEHGGLLIACRSRGDQAVIEVWDTGIGIAPEQQQEVFREFHQLGNPERDRRKGLGLGLAIAQGLARALGHELALLSEPGRGSVFRLTVPLAQEDAVAQGPQPEPSALGELLIPGARVLVIDDDAWVRIGMAQLLQGWGCSCDVADNLTEALALARIRPPDLVISDYRLRSGHTGTTAIAALRAQCGDSLPAVLVTGDTAPERIREASASGLPLLHKPVSPDQLYRCIAGVLNDH